jgi:hypothetical protein
VLAHGLREPGRPWDALHAADSVGRAVEVSTWLDEGVELRTACRRAGEGSALIRRTFRWLDSKRLDTMQRAKTSERKPQS